MTIDQLRKYHSRGPTLTTCHPEIERQGIEVITGPLGQGVANDVGLAIASKHLAATFNKPGFRFVSNHVWCIACDGCMQEGVTLEATSLAGHLDLVNLTIIYDNNGVTAEGVASRSMSEDISRKIEASGWQVIDIEEGSQDVQISFQHWSRPGRLITPSQLSSM